jgi:hypothetical protein
MRTPFAQLAHTTLPARGSRAATTGNVALSTRGHCREDS